MVASNIRRKLIHLEIMRRSDSDYLTGLIFTRPQSNGKSLMKTSRPQMICDWNWFFFGAFSVIDQIF